MKQPPVALCLSMGPIAVILLAVCNDLGKAGDLPTSVDDRICPCPWLGAEPTCSAWFASGICGTSASDSPESSAAARAEPERSDSAATIPDPASSIVRHHGVHAANSSAPYGPADAASPSPNHVETSPTEADLEEAGCPPDFLYVYGPCEHEDDFNKPSDQASVLATAEWSSEVDHGHCYDPRLMDNGTWYEPYTWLYPNLPAAISERAYGPRASQEPLVIQGDLSFLVEACICDAGPDLGLWINRENEGLIDRTTPPRPTTVLAAQKPASSTPEPVGFETVIDGPSRYLFVRREDPGTTAGSEESIGPRLASGTGADQDEDHLRSEPTRPLLTAASNLFKVAAQIALDVSRALENLNREVAADAQRPGDAIPHTAASPGDRSATGVTPFLGL